MFKPMFHTATLSLLLSLGVTGIAQAQQVASAGSKLYIVQECQPVAKGGRCALALLQTGANSLAPQNAQTTCARGWVVHFIAEKGSVEKGGINRGASVVCGYQDAQQALRAAIQACDESAFGICSSADHVKVSWAQWSATTPVTQLSGSGQPFSVQQLPGALSCSSDIPLQEGEQCPPIAAVQLRQAGVR